MQLLAELFSYGFIVRALIVGILVSLCAALLGVVLVLKRYSMIGDGLSHVAFGALAVALAFGAAPLVVSVPTVVAAAFLLLHLSQSSRLKGDAAIAVLSTSALAIGVIVLKLTKGYGIDVCNYMFGSILAMSRTDVYLSVGLSVLVLLLYLLFYDQMFSIAFDESFAQATGTRLGGYKLLIAALTAITIVVGMRMMGTLLISSLIIFPALTAMRVFSTFKQVVLSSAALAVVCFFGGIVASFAWGLPVGASVVVVNLVAFALFSLVGLVRQPA